MLLRAYKEDHILASAVVPVSNGLVVGSIGWASIPGAGLRGKDFVIVCSDTRAVQSIVTMKNDEDKVVPIDDHKVFAISGEAGDRVNFSEYIIANVRLYALRNGMKLSTKAVANYTRNELAIALRKVGPGSDSSSPLWYKPLLDTHWYYLHPLAVSLPDQPATGGL